MMWIGIQKSEPLHMVVMVHSTLGITHVHGIDPRNYVGEMEAFPANCQSRFRALRCCPGNPNGIGPQSTKNAEEEKEVKLKSPSSSRAVFFPKSPKEACVLTRALSSAYST
ncbi:hypothetical protein TREES_T100016630 [Tupaia chinensis]|uniref:Uncharacterized protein n=1 Tax=Tupaia chinensis TaxID=246437 RepID=L9L7V5_TUPCH|nr:hypothetical protein TREES_T100016630 [Tupaia chinensis]